MSESTRTLDAATLDHLQSWVGRTETLTDDITAGPVRGLSATLDRDDAPPQAGTVLAPLWHWLYFLPRIARASSALTATPGAAASFPRCRCRGACGPAGV
jgi:3-methylfumaryl-CoA hydratase